MAEAWREVRVFISSTFRDMQAERDHLVRFVFPRLREKLLERRVHLVDVDLRWGVTADQDAFDLCMDEIERCRPRFLCILGGRYGWVPPQAERSITAAEIHHGALERLDEPEFRYFYFRSPGVTASIPEPWAADYREEPGSPAERALEEVKQHVRTASGKVMTAPGVVEQRPLPVFEYPCAWDPASARIVDLRELGERVYADLLESVVAELGPALEEEPDPFAEENALAEEFVETRLEHYVIGSRGPVLQDLRERAEGAGEQGYACVVGEPGSGKSALLARFYRDYVGSHPDDLVIPHFVGVNATNVRELLRRVCHELATRSRLGGELPADYQGLRDKLPDLLEQAAQTRRVVLLVDGVNQLDPSYGAHAMSWLPGRLPERARVILTTLEGPALASLRERPETPFMLPLPRLTGDDSRQIADGFLRRYRKELSDAQRARLLAKRDAGNPLYLLTAVEELRTLGSYAEIADRIEALPDEVKPLFDSILARLEADDGFRDADGRLMGEALVRDWCSYLGLGRSGMAEDELVELVAAGDPQGNVAALQRLLRPYLMRRGQLLDFFHGQAREAARDRYLGDEQRKRAAHRELARYFRHRADPAGDGRWSAYPRGLGELPFHLAHGAGEDEAVWAELHDVLTDFRYLERKAADVGVVEQRDADGDARRVHTGVFELIDDLALADERLPSLVPLARAMRRERHVLSSRPELLWQQLHNRLQWEGEQATGLLAPELAARTAPGAPPWMRTRTPFPEAESLIVTLSGHANAVTHAAFSPDGSLLVSASTDGTLKLWDTADWTERATLRGHTGPVWGCAISQDGRLVVSAGDDWTVRVWDVATESESATLWGHAAAVHACALSPDGRLVASAGEEGNLKLWSLATGAEDATLWGHADAALDCAFGPEGTLLSASRDKTLKLWDLRNRTELTTLRGHSELVAGCAVSPDGSFAVSVGTDMTPRLWDLGTGVETARLEGHGDAVSGCAIAPDGSFVATAAWDMTVKLWDPSDGSELETFAGHSQPVHHCAISPDGSLLVSASWDMTLKVWHIGEGRTAAGRAGHYLWLNACAFAPAGDFLVTAGFDKTVRTWTLPDGEEWLKLVGHAEQVTACAVSPDGTFLASGGSDGELKLWGMPGAWERATLRGHDGGIMACAVGPDGSFVASAGEDGTVRIWDVASGRERATLRGHAKRVPDCAIGPDGSFLVSAGEDGTVRVWDVASGNERAVLRGHDGSVNGCAVSSDGSFLVSAGHDRTLRIWDGANGRERATLRGHADRVLRCAVSLDGGLVVSASDDKTVRAWDLGGCRELAALPLMGAAICVDLHPRRPLLAAGDAGGNLYLADLVGAR